MALHCMVTWLAFSTDENVTQNILCLDLKPKQHSLSQMQVICGLMAECTNVTGT